MTRSTEPWLKKIMLFPMVLLVMPIATAAQTVSFPELAAHIKTGNVVALTTADGQKIVGKVAALTTSDVTLSLHPGTRTIAATDVRTIVVRDPVWKGALIGLAAGTFIGLASAATCAPPIGSKGDDIYFYDYRCFTRGDQARLVGLNAAIGAIVGGGIDGLINRKLTLAPVISARSQRILASIRF